MIEFEPPYPSSPPPESDSDQNSGILYEPHSISDSPAPTEPQDPVDFSHLFHSDATEHDLRNIYTRDFVDVIWADYHPTEIPVIVEALRDHSFYPHLPNRFFRLSQPVEIDTLVTLLSYARGGSSVPYSTSLNKKDATQYLQRHQDLVLANDRGLYFAMHRIGAVPAPQQDRWTIAPSTGNLSGTEEVARKVMDYLIPNIHLPSHMHIWSQRRIQISQPHSGGAQFSNLADKIEKIGISLSSHEITDSREQEQHQYETFTTLLRNAGFTPASTHSRTVEDYRR